MAHVIVVGGGIAGLLTARRLHQAGARVTLLERGRAPARESSWAGGGILSPLYPWRYDEAVTRLSLASQAHYPELCAELAKSTGIDPQRLESGLFIHAPDEIDPALAWARRHQQQVELLSAQAVAQREPARHLPPGPMLWFPRIAQVRNPRLAKALIADLERRGVTLRTHAEVVAIDTAPGRSPEVVLKEERLSADRVVVCAGAWSARLLPQPLPIRPVRGQMLLFRTSPGLIRHMMLEANRYIIPRRDGRVLFGSTLEEAGFEKRTTEQARRELWEIACQRFPALKEQPIEAHWAGLRPASPAGIPFIGPVPGAPGLFVNAGHFRNGVVLGPASARLAAELILEQTPFLDPAPYALDRPRPQDHEG